MRLTNGGEVPVHIAADARLLALDVTPRGARAPVRCELPADMRPGDELESALVVPPGRSYAETFEPRLYCFGPKTEALASGATVVAHLGWSGPANAPPYAVAALEGVEPEVASLKWLDGLAIALPDERTPPTDAQPPPSPKLISEIEPAHMAFAGSAAVDASSRRRASRSPSRSGTRGCSPSSFGSARRPWIST